MRNLCKKADFMCFKVRAFKYLMLIAFSNECADLLI